jgi:hypothetical protein
MYKMSVIKNMSLNISFGTKNGAWGNDSLFGTRNSHIEEK